MKLSDHRLDTVDVYQANEHTKNQLIKKLAKRYNTLDVYPSPEGWGEVFVVAFDKFDQPTATPEADINYIGENE